MKPIQCVAVLLITVTHLISASAAKEVDKLELVGKDIPTSVSGYSGLYKVLGTDGHYQALREIYWGEKSDNPCGMKIYTQHINNLSMIIRSNVASKYTFGEFSWVTGNLNQQSIKMNCHGNDKIVSTMNSNFYIYKVNVCTTDKKNSSHNKLKGIRIWSRQLVKRNYKDGEDPELIDEPTPQEATHTHCERWHTPVQCGPGEIAQRLAVHYNYSNLDYDEDRWVVGLALYCKKVRLKKPPGKTQIEESPNELPDNPGQQMP